MINLIISLFSINIASFVLSNYFFLNKLEDEYKYKSSKYFIYRFIASFILISLIFVGYIIGHLNLIKISFSILLVVVLYEIIISIIKIDYYNKKFKLILELKEYNINKDMIRKRMVIDALKNVFYLLGAPFLVLKYLMNLLLNKIFK